MTATPLMLTIAEAEQCLRFCDSYSRMPVLVDLSLQMDPSDWQVVLGQEWPSCDNIGLWRHELRRALPVRGPVPQMMTDDERAAYAALPEVLTVYRGCGPENLRGASWSLDREVAARFPFLNRYRTPMPVLVTASVRKHQILAVKLDRDEAEAITFAARRVSVEKLHGGAA